jgi:signal transduction histidine kinase
LNNLLNNALKFTKEGDITLGYSINKYKDQIRFFVQDTGLGIPKSNQKLIFGRFRQTQEGEKNKYKGTGLGLAISKGIVELMRGKLEVVSQPGKGSEFFFTLPLNDPEA